jgi:transcriptional regulator GlxA family with amidase domain
MRLTPGGVLGVRPDLVIVSGGGWASKVPDSAWGEVRRGVIPAAIADRHARGSRIAGVCTGAMLIAASGILRGRPAVTHRSALNDLADFGVDVRPAARVVDDDDVLTSGGVTSGIDLAPPDRGGSGT